MLSVKKPFTDFKLNMLITNVENGYWQYYVSIVAMFIGIMVINVVLYQYVFFQKQEKEIAFMEGNEESIKNTMLSDLKIIFDKSSNLDQLNVLKNYSRTSLKKQNIIVIGNILYISRGPDQMVFDLQPLISLVNSILANNFFYQITLNDKVLITNIEDSDFSSVKKYQINKENFLTVKLNLINDSQFMKTNLQQFSHQVFVMIISSVLSFLTLIPLVIYLIRKIQKLNELDKKMLILKEEWKLTVKYTKVFHDLVGQDGLFKMIPAIKTDINQLNVTEFVEEIRVLTLAYNVRIFYRFELQLISNVLFIDTKFNMEIFKQIIISLLFNVLYFMRGGSHIRKFSINFQEDRVVITYDSFAANEKHMCQWSEDISENLGNPYVLNCRKIFQLMKQCGLSCEVVPKQGNNIITISNLNRNEVSGRVINFNKR